MGQNDNTLRGQSNGYKKRLVEPVVSRNVRGEQLRPAAAYRVTKKATVTTTLDVISAPLSSNKVKAVTTPSIKPPVISIKKPHPPTTSAPINRQVSTPASKLNYQHIQAQKKVMKHIPTLPAPSRKGLLGLFDKLSRLIFKRKKLIGVLAGLVIIAAAGWYGQTIISNRSDESKAIAINKAVTAATDPDAAAAYIEVQPTIGSIDAYKVDAANPRVLTIPKIGILTSIKPVGIGGTNQIANPQNIYEAGWYESSAKPGEPGAVALITNVSGPTKPSIFNNLKSLTKGDSILIERGDGQSVRYVVVATEGIAYGRPILEKMTTSKDPAKEGLNIITASGAFNRANESYLNRLIIYAVRENLAQ